MKRLMIITAGLALACLVPAAGMAQRDQGKRGALKAIRKVVADYAKAFNKGDAEALAALFGPQGDYLGPRGERITGRDAIRQRFGEFFSVNEQTRLKITVTAEAASRIRDAGAMVCRFASDEPLPHASLGANERLVYVLWGDTTIVEQTKERKVRR